MIYSNLKKDQCLILFFTFILACITNSVTAQPGTLDTSFGVNGIVTTFIDTFSDKGNSVLIQDDGKILVGGSTKSSYITSDFVLLRYNTDGSLDDTFGTNGKVITTIENRSQGNALSIQSDGKILLGGSSNQYINLARYHVNGDLDTTFGNGGKVITDVNGYYSEKCRSMIIQNDGKILVGGYGNHYTNDKRHFIVVRYLEDGTLDTTFGTNGAAIGGLGMGHTLQVQSDGNILLGGTSDFSFAIERYTTNGELDATFGVNGMVTTQFGNVNSFGHAMQLQSNGQIILGGYGIADSTTIALARYNANGTLDSSFGLNGKLLTPFGELSKVNALKIQSDGKIVIGGEASNDLNPMNFALVRYLADGSLDPTFGTNGQVLTPIGSSYSIGHALDIGVNGDIVMTGMTYTGSYSDIALTRYNGNSTVGINESVNSKTKSIVYPNPFSENSTIYLSKPVKDARLAVYNTNGQIVSNQKNIQGQKIELGRSNLSNGIYFFQLQEYNTVISTGKLIVGEKY